VTVPLSAGQQTVQVKNTGNDWFNISSYEFKPNTGSLLNSIGLSNNNYAYIWIYDINSQYGKTANGTFHNEPVIIEGLDDERYIIDIYSTRGNGGIIHSETMEVSGHQLTYTLPDFSNDIAVKVRPYLIGLPDLDAFCDYWLQTGSNIIADLNHDGNVDFVDFSILAGYWMNNCPTDWPF
jgi:hypothetical protein